MALINQNKYLYIVSYANEDHIPPEPHERYGNFPGPSVRNWDDRNYWYIEFIHGDAFYHYPIEKIVPEHILNKIKSGEIVLCLSHAHEAYHCSIESIYKYVVVKSGIPASSILYLTNSADIDKEITHVSNLLGLPKFESEFMSLFELVAKSEYEKHTDAFNKTKHLSTEKKFLCLNGLWRPHRTALISLLHCHDLLGQGYVSYNAMPHSIPTPNDRLNILREMFKDEKKTLDLLNANEEKLLDLDRIYLDSTPETHNISLAHYPNTNKLYYENSMFTVVTESLCNENASGKGYTLGRTLSEKTWKPILNMHPFIILAVPGTLKLLRSLGYKTFSPLIDESYDDEVNDAKRAVMVANEVKRLCCLNKHQTTQFIDECNSITLHNFNTLMSKKTFNYSII